MAKKIAVARAESEASPAYVGDASRPMDTEDSVINRALEILAARFKGGSVMSDPRRAREYLMLNLARHPNEVFGVMFLDAQHRLLAFEELFRGSISSTEVHPREIVRRALAHNAAAIILSHNHPSGMAEPSQADRVLTARIVEVMGFIGVRVLDHIVVGFAESVSMAERNMM